MKKQPIVWLASLAACGVVIHGAGALAAEQGSQTIDVRASVTTRDTHLTHKYVVPFLIPAGSMLTGFHGTVSTTSATDGFSESLLMVSVRNSPTCSTKEEEVADYNTIFTKFAGHGLVTIIVKQAIPGTRTEKIDLDYPVGVPLPTRCGFVTLDGSDFHSLPYRMSVNLQMSVVPQRDPPGMLRYGAHDEFVLGANHHDNAFGLSHITADTTLHAVIGTLAASVIPKTDLVVPNADWEVTHSVLVLHGGCKMFPNPKQDTSSPVLDSLMHDKEVVYSTTMTGHGREALFKVVDAVLPTPVQLKAGDCLVHAVHSNTKGTTNQSGFNTEAQVYYQTVGG